MVPSKASALGALVARYSFAFRRRISLGGGGARPPMAGGDRLDPLRARLLARMRDVQGACATWSGARLDATAGEGIFARYEAAAAPTARPPFPKCAPRAVIAGFQKCGTTFIYTWLARDAAFVPPLRGNAFKETHAYRVLSAARDRFEVFPFLEPEDRLFTGDGSVTYAIAPKAAAALAEDDPNVRVLLMVRDAFERAVSDYSYMGTFWGPQGKNVTLGQQLRREMARLRDDPHCTALADLAAALAENVAIARIAASDGGDGRGTNGAVTRSLRMGLKKFERCRLNAFFGHSLLQYGMYIFPVARFFATLRDPMRQLRIVSLESLQRNETQVLRNVQRFFLGPHHTRRVEDKTGAQSNDGGSARRKRKALRANSSGRNFVPGYGLGGPAEINAFRREVRELVITYYGDKPNEAEI